MHKQLYLRGDIDVKPEAQPKVVAYLDSLELFVEYLHPSLPRWVKRRAFRWPRDLSKPLMGWRIVWNQNFDWNQHPLSPSQLRRASCLLSLSQTWPKMYRFILFRVDVAADILTETETDAERLQVRLNRSLRLKYSRRGKDYDGRVVKGKVVYKRAARYKRNLVLYRDLSSKASPNRACCHAELRLHGSAARLVYGRDPTDLIALDPSAPFQRCLKDFAKVLLPHVPQSLSWPSATLYR